MIRMTIVCCFLLSALTLAACSSCERKETAPAAPPPATSAARETDGGPPPGRDAYFERKVKQYFINPDVIIMPVHWSNVFTPEILQQLRELGQDLRREVPYLALVDSLADMEYLTYSSDAGLSISQLLPPEGPIEIGELERIKQAALDKPHTLGRLFSGNYSRAAVIAELDPYPAGGGSDEAKRQEVEQALYRMIHSAKYRDLPLVTVYPEREFRGPRLFNLVVDFGEPGAARKPEELKVLDKLIEELSGDKQFVWADSVLPLIKDLNMTVSGGGFNNFFIPETKEEIARLLGMYEQAGGQYLSRWLNSDSSALRARFELLSINSPATDAFIEKLKTRAAELFPGAEIGVVSGVILPRG